MTSSFSPGPDCPLQAPSLHGGAQERPARHGGSLFLACLIGLLLLLDGCAGLPSGVPPAASHADDEYAQTALYRMTAPKLPDDGRSGLRLLPVASYAMATRIALARSAQRTLDLQYYLLKNDNTGQVLMRELRAAARRGVRVRLLLDDLYTVGEDPILLDLAAEPNFEVRLFNPFVVGRASRLTRFVGAAFELGRVDRRMHNKLFVADNAAAVMGGRNIGDEYFMRAADSNFVDIDVFVAGPAVRDLSRAFDSFWNSDLAIPIVRLAGPAPVLAQADRELDRLTVAAQEPPLQALPAALRRFGTLPDEIAQGSIDGLNLAPCSVVVDRPDKTGSHDDLSFPTVTRFVLAMLAAAQSEAVMVSPYFVPGERGMKMMREARQKGGRVVLVTNSLASTDSPLAQLGYMRYRKAMLREGVEIRELSPSRSRERRRFGAFGSSSGSLHAKVVITDKEKIFFGSMNLDYRSAYTNTEVGIIVESPEIVRQFEALVDEGSFFVLHLDADDNIRWTLEGKSDASALDTDPETSWWQRLMPTLLDPFVAEDEL
jgi:putative cardiolipin synthase